MVLKKISLAEQAYLELVRMIVENRCEPGTSLTEEALAAQFGISRTPVREALHRLAEEGFIEAEARRGYRICCPDEAAIRELFECRALLEVEVMKLALPYTEEAFWRDLMVRCDEAAAHDDHEASCEIDAVMHETLQANCPNRYLRDMAANLMRRSAPYRDLRNYSQAVARPLAERRALAECFARRDADAAAELLRRHILNGIPGKITQ